MDGMSDIERLMALEEIKLLKAQRDRAADTKDWDLYLSLHAPDHKSHNQGLPPWDTAAEMIANISRMMAHCATVHHSHTPEITFEGPHRARGIWAMDGFAYWTQDGQDHSFAQYGYYHETYEKREGRWLFTSRQLKYIYTKMTPGAVFPPTRPEQMPPGLTPTMDAKA